MLDQLVGVLVELVHPPADGRLGVVVAENQGPATPVANAADFRRPERQIIAGQTRFIRTTPPAADPPDDFVVRDGEVDDGVELQIELIQQGVEGDRLGVGAGVAVHDEAFRPVGAAEEFGHDVVDDDIGDEQALFDQRLDEAARGGPLADRVAQDGPGADVG